MERTLVVGYGNPLRSDDGIAWQAAEQLRHELPTARVICVHQLTPELAEDAASADLVIFLDASSTGKPGSVRCEAVFTRPNQLRFSHHLTPSEVLTLSARLFSAKPAAFLISIHGACFHHGQVLSPTATQAIPDVVARVHDLVRHLSEKSTAPGGAK
jgi:hydrogenase maturation protease